MEEYGRNELENLHRSDEFRVIRERFEKMDMMEQLKTTMFGGYSKKDVLEVITTYKEMVAMMQDNFDFQLKQLTAERERISNERTVLKRQLNEEPGEEQGGYAERIAVSGAAWRIPAGT